MLQFFIFNISDEPRLKLKRDSNQLLGRLFSFSYGKETVEARRERKAAHTLVIITGAFVICWLPFFTLALIRPFYGENFNPSKVVENIVSWLGFMNSILNPIIYTIFNPEFRAAFERILLTRKLNRSSSVV